MSLVDAVLQHAGATPDRPALRFGGEVWSYAELGRRVYRETALLRRYGIGRGDRIAVLALNHPRTLALLLACARLGAMLTPLNWRLAGPELQWILDDAGPRLLFVDANAPPLARAGMTVLPISDAGRAEEAAELTAEWQGDDSLPLLLVYTSGTTGRPKGALLTGNALRANAALSWHMHAMTATDHVLTVLPLFHVGGMNIQTIPALLLGASVTLHPRFEAAATLQAIAQDRPTLTVLVPATLEAVSRHPDWGGTDLSGLRAIATGSTVIQPATLLPVLARGVTVLQVYGSTETAPIAIYTPLGSSYAVTSTGHPGPGCAAKAVDDAGGMVSPGTAGELWLRGPQLFEGYWRNPAASAEALQDGWYRTGDIGTEAPDGSWTVHDRKKNLIISGGENIYPAEIERVLHEFPPVLEAAVVAAPDPRWQEVPEAYVVLRPGADCTQAEIIAHVHGQLARFKAPRRVHFVESLPRNVMGKVQHALLRPPGAAR